MAELADALDLGSNAQKACRFKSCSRHQQSPQIHISWQKWRRRLKQQTAAAKAELPCAPCGTTQVAPFPKVALPASRALSESRTSPRVVLARERRTIGKSDLSGSRPARTPRTSRKTPAAAGRFRGVASVYGWTEFNPRYTAQPAITRIMTPETAPSIFTTGVILFTLAMSSI